MASSTQRSSSSGSVTPLTQRRIVIAFDATKSRNIEELKNIITNIRLRGDMLEEVDSIKVLGILHKVLHPLGFHIQIGPESFVGAHARAIEEEVSRKVDAYVGMLQHSAEECEGEGVDIEVKVAVGAPMNKVLVQEIVDLKATWAIFDRLLRKELRFYLKHLPCKVAMVCDNLSVAVLRPHHTDRSTERMKHKLLYSLSKPVSPPRAQDNKSGKNSVVSIAFSSPRSPDILNSNLISLSTSHPNNIFLQDEFGSNPQQEISGSKNELENKYEDSPQLIQEETSLQNHSEVPVICPPSEMKMGQNLMCCDEFSSDNSKGNNANVENKHNSSSLVQSALQIYSDTPVLFPADEIKMDFDSLGCSYSSIQTATENFSPDNFLGEDEYGIIYKGQLKDGQLIAVKVQNETNTQGCAEFDSEVYALSFARHTNIVTLLGYCCKENLNILIYEYTCNKSLEWHLFDNTERILDWHQRYAIAIGTAEGLRFLHEECWGGPIVHRDIRPSNILLTDDFVPLLGNFGLAKWKRNEYDKHRKILGNLSYLAPEYAETGIFSARTDVYEFGIVLLQLISGRRAVDSTRENYQQSIRQWALPSIHTLKLHELVDPRLGDSYTTYELYNMARTASLCVQTNPVMRPTMGEVLCLLEGANDHLRHVNSNLYPMILSAEADLS